MTAAATDLALYALALVVLVLIPGPVVVATVARTLGSGFSAAMPLAAGVAIGDMLWPTLALLGLSALAELYGEAMQVLRWVGAAILVWMGWRLIAHPREAVGAPPDPALLRREGWRSFTAGVLVNLGNPKSIFFYIGVLPGFFRIAELTPVDIGVIVAMSAVVPFLGNVLWAGAASGAKKLLRTPRAVRAVDRASGGALIGAGALVAAS